MAGVGCTGQGKADYCVDLEISIFVTRKVNIWPGVLAEDT